MNLIEPQKKFLVDWSTIPDKKYYQMDSYKNSWYKFIDRECYRFRIMSKFNNPWEQKDKMVLVPSVSFNKSSNSVYPAFYSFKLYPVENDEELLEKELFREYRKGHFIYSTKPNYMFSGFPIEDEGLKPLIWLTYSILI